MYLPILKAILEIPNATINSDLQKFTITSISIALSVIIPAYVEYTGIFITFVAMVEIYKLHMGCLVSFFFSEELERTIKK